MFADVSDFSLRLFLGDVLTEDSTSRVICVVTPDVVELESAEELYQRRVTRILTNDFPVYFALVTRIRQETKVIGLDGGLISSTVVPQVQAVFPDGAIQKSIRVGVQVTSVTASFVDRL